MSKSKQRQFIRTKKHAHYLEFILKAILNTNSLKKTGTYVIENYKLKIIETEQKRENQLGFQFHSIACQFP